MTTTVGVTHQEAVGAAEATDSAYAERFAEAYGLDLRFNHRRTQWFVYRAGLWRPDVDGEVYRLAIAFARQCQQTALDNPNPRERGEQIKNALRMESKAALDRVISLARNIRPLTDAGQGWDAAPMLMGTPAGILNLQTGTVMGPDPSVRITFSTSVSCADTVDCPRFLQFLDEIFRRDRELIDFVHRFVGYCCSGDTTEQVLAVLYGTGANGKSTLLNVLSRVLGDYAINMPFSTIEMKQRASIPNDLAALDGRRFVTASETNDGARLNEARVKALTGSDKVTARFLHGEYFSFVPQAKFFLAVNHRPVVRDDSFGFWRRIRLVPFLERFEGTHRDDTLEQQLRAEGPGILRWAVDGCVAWQEHGLGAPRAVMAATDEYREDSDPLAEFLVECTEIDAPSETRASAIQQTYCQWADTQRISKSERLTAKDLGRRLAERFTRRHTRDGWVYTGLRITTGKLW